MQVIMQVIYESQFAGKKHIMQVFSQVIMEAFG